MINISYVLFYLKFTYPYNICYYRDYDTMNPANHNQREHSSSENVSKSSSSRITTTLPFPSSKQIISISIIVSLFSLSVMMIIFDFNTMSKNIAFAQNTTNQSSSSPAATTPFNCTSLPAKISKNAVALQNPNKDVCDIVILRQSPQIIGHNGTILNKFLAINSLVEIMNAPSNMSKSSVNSSQPMVVVMGEFALLQSELKPILMAMSQSNWNITAVHNHPILEKPPMIFVHWDALGNLNTIAAQIKEVMTLDQNLSLQQTKVTGNNTSSDNPISAIGKQIGSAIGLGSNGGGK
jgi:hypothetical protein